MSKKTSTAAMKSKPAEKFHHYKVKKSGLAALASKFFVNLRPHEKEKVEKNCQVLNCNRNVNETQCFG